MLSQYSRKHATIRPDGHVILRTEAAVKSAPNEYTQDVSGLVKWIQKNYPSFVAPIDDELIQAHAHKAFALKYFPQAYSWTKEYDDDMFLNYILPLTHFDEKPEAWMTAMEESLSPLVAYEGMTLQMAAEAIAKGIWDAFGSPSITFKANQTPAILSPLSDVLEKRYGSCTAMSIFLADGLRSVGVPARVVGIAQWNRPEGGNHNWVEAWYNGKWNFIDAVPGVTTWNTGWFTEEGLAQKSEPFSIMAIATPVWNKEKATGQYYVTWKKGEAYQDSKPGDSVEAVIKIPAIDLTEEYGHKSSGSGQAVRSSSQFRWKLLSAPALVLLLLAH